MCLGRDSVIVLSYVRCRDRTVIPHRNSLPPPHTHARWTWRCLSQRVHRFEVDHHSCHMQALKPSRRGSSRQASSHIARPRVLHMSSDNLDTNTTSLRPGTRGAATAQGALGWYRPSVGVPRDVGCCALVAYIFSVQFSLTHVSLEGEMGTLILAPTIP